MDGSTTRTLASKATAMVITPRVRLVATRPAPAGDLQESEQDLSLGDAMFEEQHRAKEVDERRALNGCVWFHCQACSRVRRLMKWNSSMSKRRRLPTRCEEHPEPRRRIAGCAATDEWLAARLGAAFGDLVHNHLVTCVDGTPRDTKCLTSIERDSALAELGVVTSPLTELLLRKHLFICVPQDPQCSVRADPPPLYRLAEGCVVWAQAKHADWWPGHIVASAVRSKGVCPQWSK